MTNKTVSETPLRTLLARYDSGLRVDPGDTNPHWIVEAEDMEELEKELNAANSRIKELEAKLATARDDALEKAAKSCDVQAADWIGMNMTGIARKTEAELCAQIIRSLKSSSGGVG